MRLDKYLKVSRLILRRPIAKEVCDNGRILINDKVAKASTEVKVNDILTLNLGSKVIKVKVLEILEYAKKKDANLMYEIISKVENGDQI